MNMRSRQIRWAAWLGTLLVICAPAGLRAQRDLHWDTLDVEARLDAGGVLHVTEVHTMVFTGDWNGGERMFNLRSRQRLTPVSVERVDAAGDGRHALTPDDDLDDVDDYSWRDVSTLRWRSRLPSDRPFSNARLTYAITYQLSGILRSDGESYQLDHDFAFPDRAGAIEQFSLRLTLDPEWQPSSPVQERYIAGPLAPGRGFVLAMALRHGGSGSPIAIDTRRSPVIAIAAWGLLLFTALALAGLFRRESRLGRFAAVSGPGAGAEWLARNILVLPAEVVGAAWDGAVGTPEVVALIARLVAEEKLTSETDAAGSLTLRLNVDRSSLQRYERTLVDGLFFDGRVVTTTEEVKAHYKSKGFDPATLVAPALEARVKEVLPSEGDPPRSHPVSILLFVGAVGMLAAGWLSGGAEMPIPFVLLFFAVFAAVLAQIPGRLFRQRIDWGRRAAALCLIPAVLIATATAAFLWFFVGPDSIDLSALMIGAIGMLAAWSIQVAVSALESRQSREAIAFRKKLAAGRWFLKSQLMEARPSLQDSWYPWVLAFGLTKDADRWSARHASSTAPHRGHSTDTATTGTAPAWTGAGGGRSGGAGGGAGWTTAVAGMAAGVAAPSSSSSGGSSSGGSSGGGGGGGW